LRSPRTRPEDRQKQAKATKGNAPLSYISYISYTTIHSHSHVNDHLDLTSTVSRMLWSILPISVRAGIGRGGRRRRRRGRRRPAPSSVVTPLAVTTGTPELAGNTRTVWKRAHAAPYALTASYRIDRTTPLDKDGIDVRGTVGSDLSWRDGASHEGNILTWHGQDRTLLVCVTNRGKLLLSYE